MMSYIRTGEKMYEHRMCGCGGSEGCGCGCSREGGAYEGVRSFLTKEEKIDVLKGYKESLEKEAKGIDERIKALQKGN